MTAPRTSGRSSRRVTPRSRAYVVLLNAHDSNTSNVREDIAVPGKGKRVRVLRVRVIQERADGRHLYEVYFGDGETINANPDKAVDVLDLPNLGEASTRTYLREEGPRGLRDEPLSGRWAGSPPRGVHKVMVEYTEES